MATITLVAMVTHLIVISILYFEHPVMVTVSMRHESELIFPAITLCNMSPVKKSLLSSSILAEQILARDGKGGANKRRKRALGKLIDIVKSTCISAYVLSAKINNLNCQPLKVVSRYRDPQLQVCDNYLFNLRPNICKS